MNIGKISHEQVDRPERDLINKKLKNYQAKFCLLGFHCDSKSIKLDDNHLIKKESKKETHSFYVRTGKNENHIADFFSRYDCFLFYKYVSNDHPVYYPVEVENKSISFEMFLWIFFDCEVSLKYCNRYIINNDNQEQSIGFITTPRRELLERSDLTIERTEVNRIKKYWKLFTGVETSSKNVLDLVHRRIYNSYERINGEDKLIDLMIGFEAIFLESGMELKYKLSLRVSKFLASKYDPLFVFDLIQKSYDLRSKVVHGTTLKAKDYTLRSEKIGINDYVQSLRYMLGDCIKFYYTKYGDLSFGELNRKIDRAIVSSSKI